ncbi:MAG TPA: AMP-binding protein [Ramlibacter sp.]|jgi:4-coumarate--CoA ligase (photoactive yellow protein activation family)|nr:AMP-binding protein [Ramlibacter sp.]
MRAWWQPRGVLRRFTFDLLADEMARHRRATIPHAGLWRDDLRLDADLGVDSLELMTLATALAEALHLGESGIEDYLLARRTLGDWVDIAGAGLERFNARLTFRTSGSTGQPKPCVHEMATLVQEVQHLATLFPGRTRVLCAVPAHHIYGYLFSVLLPHELGLCAEDVVDLRGSTPAWLARGARPGDLVVGHPEFWSAVGRTVSRMPADVVGVTSTAPCADAVCEAVEAAGIARLVQVYGASETAGIAARASHREPYTLFPYWGLRGDVLVRTMTDGTERIFPGQDHLQACGDRQLRIGPRLDHAVQVGGINVFPSRVREVLKRHPLVQDAAVRLMRPDEGTRLKAFVVPRPDVTARDALLEQLQAWIASELTTPERPKAIHLGDALPLSATGKLVDWDLSRSA